MAIRQLKIPKSSSQHQNDDNDGNNGWDINLGEDHLWKVFQQHLQHSDPIRSNVMTSFVIGHTDGYLYSTSNWRRSFYPYQILQVCSNQSDSIIAVSLSNGSVALLRERDGNILANRKIIQNSSSNNGRFIPIKGTTKDSTFIYIQNSTNTIFL